MKNDFKTWINKQESAEPQKGKSRGFKKKGFVGNRGYLHFDGRIPLSRLTRVKDGDPAYKLLTSTRAIANHTFLPFLREDQRVKRYKRKPSKNRLGETRTHTERFSTVKNRPIMYASHLDSCVYSLYNNILSSYYEERIERLGLTESVIAYRSVNIANTVKNKSNVDFALDLHEGITTSKGDVGILLVDVSGFFDNINHGLLLERWADVLDRESLPEDHRAVYRNITKYRYVHTDDAYRALGLGSEKVERLMKNRRSSLCSFSDFNSKIKKGNLIRKNKSEKGIPQGSPISGLLANMYMIDFDVKVQGYVSRYGGHYARYSDDIVVLVEPEYILDAYQYIKETLANEKLNINSKKTEYFIYSRDGYTYTNAIKHIEPESKFHLKENPQYLGFTFTPMGMLVRSNTLARRFRGSKAFLLNEDRWRYFSLATKKTGSQLVGAQARSVRRKIKPIVTEGIEVRRRLKANSIGKSKSK